MLVNGKEIAEDIYRQLKEDIKGLGNVPRLLVVTAAPNAETKKYLDLKRQKAEAVGIEVVVREFDQDVTDGALQNFLGEFLDVYDGIIIQLPLPAQIHTDDLIKKIPKQVDVDAINYDGSDNDILPPVVGAVEEIAKKYAVDFAGKKVVIVGQGRLVGKPAAFWAEAQSAAVTVIDKTTTEADEILETADIIISGAGAPGLITPDKIKEGVVIFDAGTSEEGGVLRGDADPACAEKCSLFTPVPGGIGPVTIAVLLRNLIRLAERKG